MVTILFDIDGTLIRSGGAGMRAIEAVMLEMFDLETVNRVDLHGRTDNGILTDLLASHALIFDDHRDAFTKQYWERLPTALESCEGCVLPGVNELLTQLDGIEKVASGILTGNAKRPADIKLEHFGLEGFFKFGGYGDHHSSRNDVAKLAKDAAASCLVQRFDTQKVWVVGDTVNDVTCARSIGAQVVAVETGGCDPEALKNAQPDLQLASLSDIERFLDVVVGECQA